jgi:hypothetical protein
MNSIIALGILLLLIGLISKTERPYTILWAFATPVFYLIFGFKSLYIPLGFTEVELFSGVLPMVVTIMTWFKLTPTEKRRAWKYSPKLWWIFLAYYFLSLSWSVNPSTGVRTVLELAFPSLLYLVAFNVIQSDKHLQQYYKWMAIINIIVGVFDLYNAYTGWSAIQYSSAMQEGAIGYRTVTAYFYVTMGTIVMMRMMDRFKLSYLLLYCMNVGLLLLAASRTPTFVFIAGSLIAIVYRRNFKFTVIGGFVLALLVALLLVLPSKSKFINDDDSLNMKDSGRGFFQQYFEDKSEEKPIFGFGAGGTEWYATWITNHITMVGAPHNEYLRIKFDGGKIGLFLFYLGLIDLLVRGLAMGRSLKGYFPYRAILVMTPVMFALSCTSDNTFFYFYVFTQYMFVFMGFGARLVYEERVLNGEEELVLQPEEVELVFEDKSLAVT